MRAEMRHPPDEELLLLLDGELSPRRQATAETHLARCPSCETRLGRMAEAAANSLRLCQDEFGWQRAPSSRLRESLRVRLGELSADLSRPWHARVREHMRAWPGWAYVGAAVLVASVLLAPLMVRRPTDAAPRIGDIEAAALPVSSLTPGVARPVTIDEVCAGTRQDVQVIAPSVRRAVLRDYGMEGVPDDEYELDYLITPELGGTDDRRNLWPERYSSRVWNARVKDELELLLPQLVCQGKLDLTTAQREIADNWIAAYKTHFQTSHPLHESVRRSNDDDDRSPEPRWSPGEPLPYWGVRAPRRHLVALVAFHRFESAR